MRNLLLACLLLSVAFLTMSGHPARAWEITRFDADLVIRPDASVRVVEAIRVDFGPERRHAICRALPRQVTDPSGVRRPLELDLIAVTDAAGRPWPLRVERSPRSFDVWMGSDQHFATGEQTYCLTYEVRGAVWAGPYRDELHWDVTGNAWEALVIAGGVRVAWPPGAGADQVEGASRVTRFGRVIREADVKMIDADHAQFLLNRGLLTFEGLSVSVVWPPGLVRHPGWIARAAAFTTRNPALALLPAAALLVALGARRRRDVGAGAADSTALVLPGAPEIPPAEAGYLLCGRLEPAHVAAALLELEQRGALCIARAPGGDAGADPRFHAPAATPVTPVTRAPLDARILALLFPDGATVSTLGAFAHRARREWPALAQEVDRALVARGELDPPLVSPRSPVVLGALIALALGVVTGVAGRRAAHGLLGMATAADWVAIGGASLLLALAVMVLGASLPRTTRAGRRRIAEIRRFAPALALEPADLPAEALPLAVALGAGEWIAGCADGSALVAARAMTRALGGA